MPGGSGMIMKRVGVVRYVTDVDHHGLATIADLDELATLVERVGSEDLYVRWSRGPGTDLADGSAAGARTTNPWWCAGTRSAGSPRPP